MFPSFNHSGVLPPFLPHLPHGSAGSLAPFRVSLQNFVERFATSSYRIDILTGFLNYRKALKDAGIKHGFQWVDGSFVENVEVNRGRPPSDIDIITFAYRPEEFQGKENWEKLVGENDQLFKPEISKRKFLCDAYFIDLHLPPHIIVNRTSFWYGLFSHQRESYLWKGMLEISMADDEDEIASIVNGGDKDAS